MKDNIAENVAMYAEKYGWVLNILLLVLLALTMAKTTNSWVRSSYASTGPAEQWTPPAMNQAQMAPIHQTSLQKIEERNLFQAKVREEVAEEQGPVEVNLNLCVQGIICGPKYNFATIQNNDTKQILVLGIGDEIVPGATVGDILPDRVVVSRGGGRNEEIMFDITSGKCSGGTGRPGGMVPPIPGRGAMPFQPGGTPPGGTGVQAVSETEYVIDKGEFDAQMANLNDLITKARLVPNFTPDRQVDGFRIFQIVPGSIFQKLGMRNGDVISAVNGIKMDDPTKGLELFQSLKNLSHFTIDMKRHSQNYTYTYDVR